MPINLQMNPAFAWVDAMLLAALFLSPGLAWAWLWAHTREANAARMLGVVVATGLWITLLSALVLGALDVLRPATLAGSLAVFSALGVGMGLRKRPALIHAVRTAAPGSLLVVLAFAAIALLPRQGEWILGGWDPGVYLNQGIQIAREGSFTPPAAPVHEALSPEGVNAFTRGRIDYREWFPAVPMDPDSRAPAIYFFRLFPSLIAVTAQWGGLHAATRVNLFAGVLALALLAALLASSRLRWWAPAAVLLLALHPLFLYHLHTPTSEMLHLVLLLAAAMFWTQRREGLRWNAAFSAMLLAGVLNRYDFAAFASLWLLLTAIEDASREDRAAVWRERALHWSALAAGVAADHVWSAMTLVKLGRLGGFILALGLAFAALALAVDALASTPRLRARCRGVVSGLAYAPPILLLALAALLLPGLRARLGEVGASWTGLWPYLEPSLWLAAWAGALLMLRRARDTHGKSLNTWFLFLALAACALLVESRIASVYPWATRRHLPYTLPLLVLFASHAIASFAALSHPLLRRAVPLLAIATLALAWGPRSAAAWRNTEYNGVSAHLATVARQLAPDDIVVADHHWWATPLACLHYFNVLNGMALWEKDKAHAREAAHQELMRLARAGHRIRLVTSTGDGASIFPTLSPQAALDWSGAPFAFTEIIHHRKAQGYETRTRTREFRVYTWRPPAD